MQSNIKRKSEGEQAIFFGIHVAMGTVFSCGYRFITKPVDFQTSGVPTEGSIKRQISCEK